MDDSTCDRPDDWPRHGLRNPTSPLGIATRQYAVGRAGDTMTGDLIVSQAGPSELKTISDGSTSTATLESYRTSTAAHCSVVGNAAYGSLAAPAFVGAAEANLFELSTRPWSGSTFGQQARIAFVSSEAHSATALGVDCVVSCTPAGSATRQDVVRISAATGVSMFGSNIVVDANRHLRLRSYTIATLPSAAVCRAGDLLLGPGRRRRPACFGRNQMAPCIARWNHDGQQQRGFHLDRSDQRRGAAAHRNSDGE